ncbi:heterokaryon incompatibility protein-domain-containing protein [Hypoxylon sp. FL1150]|nr:heterokaryon incompatibility protein-domain-containing protein [Hypoxylon sp. FL1150]
MASDLCSLCSFDSSILALPNKLSRNITFADLLTSARTQCKFCGYLVKAVLSLWTNAHERIDIQLRSRRDVEEANNICELEPRGDYYKKYHSILVYYLEDPNKLLKPYRVVPSSPASEKTWEFVRNQLTECFTYHDKCRAASEAPRSQAKRYLQLGAQSSTLKLVESSAVQITDYAALSYCWGKCAGDDLLLATASTLEKLQSGIAVSDLPPALKDAVEVCFRLGLKFLWIDSLCILQDSPDDWRDQAAKMADVYEGSLVTIIAASGSSVQESFLAHPRLPRPHVGDVEREEGGRVQVYARVSTDFGHHRFVSSLLLGGPQPIGIEPVDLRAWTLQERDLSVRAISYTSFEVQWACRTTQACECGRGTVNGMAQISRMLDDKDALRTWYEAVRQYTSRNLSFDADKLPAIAGLARRLAPQIRSRYIAGLWEQDLLVGLCWCKTSHSSNPSLTGRYPTAYVAPSFSWASVVGLVMKEPHVGPASQACCEVLQVHCSPTSADPYGQVQEGSSLDMYGALVPAVLTRDKEEPGIYIIRIPSMEDYRAFYMLYVDGPLESVGGEETASMHEGWMTSSFWKLISGKGEHGSDVGGVRRRKTQAEGDGIVATPFEQARAKFLPLFFNHNKDRDAAHMIGLVLGTVSSEKGYYERVGSVMIQFNGGQEVGWPLALSQLVWDTWKTYHRNLRLY